MGAVRKLLNVMATSVGLLIWMSATPSTDAAVIVGQVHRHTTVHGTLTNRHVTHAAHAATPRTKVSKPPAVTRIKTAHRRVTRSRRVAHKHRHHRAGGVGGHVRTSGGEAVAGAVVSIAKSGHGRSAVNRHVHAGRSTVTDSSGHFVIRGIRAGAHRVVATKAGLGKAGKAVHVRGGAVRTGLDIKMGTSTHKHKKHHKHK